MLTKSQKRYLFAIYRLGQNGRPVKSTEVASVLGVTKASTVKMTQKLIDEGYIIKEPYREITLTSEGIKAANELYTPSVILQDFLENRVGVERKNADAILLTKSTTTRFFLSASSLNLGAFNFA